MRGEAVPADASGPSTHHVTLTQWYPHKAVTGEWHEHSPSPRCSTFLERHGLHVSCRWHRYDARVTLPFRISEDDRTGPAGPSSGLCALECGCHFKDETVLGFLPPAVRKGQDIICRAKSLWRGSHEVTDVPGCQGSRDRG